MKRGHKSIRRDFFLIKKMEMFLRSITHKMISSMQGLELILLTPIVKATGSYRAHAKETKLIKNKKDAEVLAEIATIESSKKTVVLYRP